MITKEDQLIYWVVVNFLPLFSKLHVDDDRSRISKLIECKINLLGRNLGNLSLSSLNG